MEAYKNLAKISRMNVEEYKYRLQRKVERVVEGSQIFIVTNYATLEQMFLEDNPTERRFKTLFETGMSNGLYSKVGRKCIENELFNLSIDDDAPNQRPIYGYLSNNEEGTVNTTGETQYISNTDFYGTIRCKLRKENIANHITVTFQDSFIIPISKGDITYTASPLQTPHFTSVLLPSKEIKENNPLNIISDQSSQFGHQKHQYVEAQIHHKVKLEDIKALYIHKHNHHLSEMLQKKMEREKQRNPELNLTIIEYDSAPTDTSS